VSQPPDLRAQAEAQRRRLKRGRGRRRQIGEQHSQSKLTEEDVLMLRELYRERQRLMVEAGKVAPIKLAEKFDISVQQVYDICTYKYWNHLP